MNDDCTERIPLGRYRDHLKNKCMVTRYKTLEEPLGALAKEPANKEESQTNPYVDSFLIGDLSRMFLQPDETLDNDLLEANKRAHEEY